MAHTPERGHQGNKATPRTYALVALALTAMVAFKFAMLLFHFPASTPMLITLILLLGAAEFVLVAAFYMHLRYDTRLFAGMFTFGFFIATAIVISLLNIFRNYHF